ncbi:DNA modification methylase [Micromonospora craterilacus]|uniref:DNA modification methylase n=1 Tax=Micromonospora craterilacus TaxID=1655439 RepID=A0A2W2EM19_9ACTN|nr:DNA methyltransferase [Micromonospora craterilacus]PZG10297.1 DNA modification methylase [Micromonospora craterilacus]
MEYVETRDVGLDELTPFPGNARRGDIDKIRESIRKTGQYRSIVVRDSGGAFVVLAGNHTMQAAAAEGHDTIRCEIIRCDDSEARRINLADNKLAELGDYDHDALAELLSYLDGDYDGTGYTDDDVQALIHPADESLAALGDPDDTPPPPEQPTSVLGDVWHLGPHRLVCGDSTDVAVVEAMMGGDRADCMWTDPPYGVEYVGKTKSALSIQNDGAAGLPDLLAGAFAVATAALKPGAPIYIAHPDSFRTTFEQAVHEAGWLFRQNLIWVKNTLVLGHSDYHYRHEPILYGFTPGGDGRLGRGGDRWFGDNAQTTVFEVDKPARSEDHPTMKPVALIAPMLTNSCPRRGLVYEPFGGSGSTLIAAHSLGMAARVVELDPRYVDVICRRFQQYTGIKPVRADTGDPVDFANGSAD